MNYFGLSENPHKWWYHTAFHYISLLYHVGHCWFVTAFWQGSEAVDMLKVINSELSSGHSNNELLLITFWRQIFQRLSKKFCKTLRCHSSSSKQLKPPKHLALENAVLMPAEANIQLYICLIWICVLANCSLQISTTLCLFPQYLLRHFDLTRQNVYGFMSWCKTMASKHTND